MKNRKSARDAKELQRLSEQKAYPPGKPEATGRAGGATAEAGGYGEEAGKPGCPGTGEGAAAGKAAKPGETGPDRRLAH